VHVPSFGTCMLPKLIVTELIFLNVAISTLLYFFLVIK